MLLSSPHDAVSALLEKLKSQVSLPSASLSMSPAVQGVLQRFEAEVNECEQDLRHILDVIFVAYEEKVNRLMVRANSLGLWGPCSASMLFDSLGASPS